MAIFRGYGKDWDGSGELGERGVGRGDSGECTVDNGQWTVENGEK